MRRSYNSASLVVVLVMTVSVMFVDLGESQNTPTNTFTKNPTMTRSVMPNAGPTPAPTPGPAPRNGSVTNTFTKNPTMTRSRSEEHTSELQSHA